MSPRSHRLRAQLWLDGLGEWSWPGRATEPLELLPPSWVPASPLRLEPAFTAVGGGTGSAGTLSSPWTLGLRRGALVGVLTLACGAAALGGPQTVEHLERLASLAPNAPAPATPAPERAPTAPPDVPAPLPALAPVSSDRAGSSIALVRFDSGSLPGKGAFFVYLPPGYQSGARRYPVLYLLHGRDGHANAFLEIGIQSTLDRLIDRRAIPPMIAVMIQDRSTLNNWRDIGTHHDATYVVEVQELVDRLLRTIPARDARAIAGDSMGGFGAVNVALANPTRFSVVESWLGFFNNLNGELHADQPIIARLGLHAFLYGAAEDPVAVPAEDPEFAVELRAAGAQAQSAIYPGGHSLEKVGEHLETGLLFAGRSLEDAQLRAAAEAAAGMPPGVSASRTAARSGA
ncbi:MAG TPA: alpha/beta hydrolase-fold protein [Solirubrobacteraceae bacterium]|nr:alpha/beta hydrolase-fold protein [Solirubrobacteraceae bacterium]